MDYMIADTELFSCIKDFNVDYSRDDSDHFPLTCRLSAILIKNEDTMKTHPWTRFRWDQDKCADFQQKLNDDFSQTLLQTCDQLLDTHDINNAVSQLEELFLHAAQPMKCKQKFKSIQPVWWDGQCETAKDHKFHLLNVFRRTSKGYDLSQYKKSKSAFKTLCRRKSVEYHDKKNSQLVKTNLNVNELWKCVKKATQGHTTSPQISTKDWHNHFNDLLNQRVNIEQEFDEQVKESLHLHEINCDTCLKNDSKFNEPITEQEVSDSIKSMENNKAPGTSGIIIEFLKNSISIILPYLVKLFNTILDTGIFPINWCLAIICPLHKKGSIHDENNYRGISLLEVMGKVFTKILNIRLVDFASRLHKLFEGQAGYRQGYSTMDNIFTLQALVYKYLSKKRGRFYCIFVDFSKAFDSVDHNLLMYVLLKNGIHGKIFNVLKSMYSNLQSCVNTPEGLTELFECIIGTRQGCMLSPFFFVLFLNEFIRLLYSSGCQGIYVSEEMPNTLILLYADDMSNCSDTVGGLQHQINVLSSFCQKYGMKVNLDKTKIIVFRNGGIIRRNEKWFYNGKQIEVVPYYKYLGLFVSSRMIWSKATQTLAAQAQKAVGLIKCYNRKCGGLDIKSAFYLFDHMVTPILYYGAEVWGTKPINCIEKVQVNFCKYLLKIGTKTCNAAVLGECGRYPLFVHYHSRMVKYWVKLLHMKETRYPKQSYYMLKDLDSAGRIKSNWVTALKKSLFKFGFGYVWINQDVGDSVIFMSLFRQRLKDIAVQEWQNTINSTSKLDVYSTFKSLLNIEFYLTAVPNIKYKQALASLRCSSHKLAIEKGRHEKIIDRQQRVCLLCEKVNLYHIEDERHFILECSSYQDLRKKYIPIHMSANTQYNFISLLQSEDNQIIYNLSKYCYLAFYKREQLLLIL